MKKFIKITGVLLRCLMVFSGCAEETPPGPVVEIVERSRLMDKINIDVIMPWKKRGQLEKQGLGIDYDDFRMTSDNSAEFRLVVSSGRNTGRLKMEGFLSYDRSRTADKDYFENINFYWGDIRTDGKGTALITGIKNAYILKPDRSGLNITDIALPQEINGTDGIVLKGAVGPGGCGIVYHTEGKDYLWLADSRGVERKVVRLPLGTSALVDMWTDKVIPFDVSHRPTISFTGGNTLVTGINTAYYYNETTGTLLYGDPVVQLVNEETTLGFYKMQADRQGKERHKGDFYMAVKTQDETTESVFIAPDLLGDSKQRKNIVVSDYGYTLVSKETGFEADLNFAKGSIAALRYSIPAEKLEEKMYISTDKQKALYSYAPEEWQGIKTYNIALADRTRTQTAYIACAGLINNAYPGETGFLSPDKIYVLGCDDYRIYSTDTENPHKIFALSDKFPMVDDIDGQLADRVPVAVYHNEKTGEITALYYDTHRESPRYIAEGDIRLTDTYNLAFFDSEGNLTQTTDTGINALTGHNPVNITVKGNKITITATHRDTDTVLVKAVYDKSKDKTTVIQKYRPYEEK